MPCKNKHKRDDRINNNLITVFILQRLTNVFQQIARLARGINGEIGEVKINLKKFYLREF